MPSLRRRADCGIRDADYTLPMRRFCLVCLIALCAGFEPLPDEREVLDFLVGVAQDWIAVNAASRGLPPLA